MTLKHPRRTQVFLWAGAFAILIALVGFAKTFFYPLLTGTFRAHPMVYVHGVFLFGWVAFFLSQSVLVHRKKLRFHKKMGWAGGALVVGVVVSTLYIATLASHRAAAAGNMDQASAELLVIMIEMLVFSGLIAAALVLRKHPETHKRLMLLALIGSLGPAWFRFRHYFPEVNNPVFLYSLLLADSLILIAAASDMLRHRRVHPVYIFVGSGVVVVHLIEVFMFDAPWFQAAADKFAGPFI